MPIANICGLAHSQDYSGLTHLTSTTDGELPELPFESRAGRVPTLVVDKGVFTGKLGGLENFSVAIVIAHHRTLREILKMKKVTM